MPRKVDRLLWAKPCDRPDILPKRKVDYRNARAIGVRYEKAVGQAVKDLRLGTTLRGQWFEFCDANGHGYCQTDVVVVCPEYIIAFECKLTEVEEAREQLEWLYVPVLQRVFRRPIHGIIVARHLTRNTHTEDVCDSVEAALRAPRWPILHWIGRGPIGHTVVANRRWSLDYALRRPAS